MQRYTFQASDGRIIAVDADSMASALRMACRRLQQATGFRTEYGPEDLEQITNEEEP